MAETVAGFDWEEGNWPKCAKHGVSRREIEEVLAGRPLVLPDRTGGGVETRFNAVGRSLEGRYLFIVFTFRSAGEMRLIRPISARDMHAEEVRNYERQKGA